MKMINLSTECQYEKQLLTEIQVRGYIHDSG